MRRLVHISAKAIKYILLGLVLLIVTIVIFLNSNFVDSLIRKQIATRLSKALNRDVTVKDVAFNPFFLEVELKDFRIANDPRSPEVPFFAASDIYARVSWQSLLSGKLRISNVRVVRPELHVIFYIGGGNNWPKTSPKSGPKKKGGLNFVISRCVVEKMMVVFNNRRLPLDFSTNDLETHVQYDPIQNNYLASTNFQKGSFRIMNYEFWHFDLKSTYRIIGGRVSFERLFFLSPQSKFYMAGDMYNLKDPFFDFRFRSQIHLSHAKQMFRLNPEMSGVGTYKAVYKGTFTRFRMQGEGNFRNIIFYSLPIDQTKFDLEMTENWLNLSNIRAEMFGGSYKGNFNITPIKGKSIFKTDGSFEDWDGRRLGRFIRMTDMVLPVAASGNAILRWEEGHMKDMTGDFRFAMEPRGKSPYDLAVAAEESNFDNSLYRNTFYLPVRSETQFRIEGRQLRDLKSYMEMPNTKMDVAGTIDFSGKADLTVHSQSERIPEIDLLFHHLQSYFKKTSVSQQEFWKVRGKADFNGKLDATVWGPFQPRLSGEVFGRNIFYHGVSLDEVRSGVIFYRSRIDVLDATMVKGRATGNAQATFLLSDSKKGTVDQINLTGGIQNFPAEEIPHAFYRKLPVMGRVNATVSLKGALEDPEGQSDFEALNGELYGEKWDRASGTVLFFPNSLGLRNLKVHRNGGTAEVSGDLEYESKRYNVTFSAKGLPLQQLETLRKSGLEISGMASAKGNGQGTLSKPQLEGEITIQNLMYKAELYGEVKADVLLSQGALILDASGITRGVPSKLTARLELDGNLPYRAVFNIDKFPLEILIRAYAPSATSITGVVGGDFTLTGTLRPADVKSISGALDMIRMNLAGIQLDQARPLKVVLNNNVIQIQDSLLQGEHVTVGLTGTVHPKDSWKLDLNLSADIGLEILSQWDPDITANGTTTVKVAIGGNLKQPTLTGAMEIREGFFRHFSFPNSLTDIAALVTFRNQNVTLQSLTAKSSGGSLTAGGSATLKGYSLDTYRFDLYANEIRINYPEGLRSTVNAELHLQTQLRKNYLVGEIEVLQGVYTRSFEETPSLFNYARVPTFAALGGAPQPGKELELSIHIRSEANLMVRNNFANAVSSADLNLIGSLDNPVLIGRMEVHKGTVTFRDREYKIVRGALDFDNPYRTEPVLNFVAETRVREYTVTLTFSGTFDQIYHELSSDPPLPRDDIYALLGIGTTREAVQGVADVSALIAGQQISEFITSPITSPLEREFKKVFGLQRFQIDPVFVQTTQVATARITLQKELSSDFSITYSTNVFTAAEEIILLQYQLTDDVQITASKDEQSRYGIDVLVTKTFE